MRITLAPDFWRGTAFQSVVTLTNADTVYTVDLPNSARGLRIRPSGGDVVYALDEDPAAIGAGTTLVPGNVVLDGEVDTRLFIRAAEGHTTLRQLRLRSASAGATVRVETF